jgi:hypothetical protein
MRTQSQQQNKQGKMNMIDDYGEGDDDSQFERLENVDLDAQRLARSPTDHKKGQRKKDLTGSVEQIKTDEEDEDIGDKINEMTKNIVDMDEDDDQDEIE